MSSTEFRGRQASSPTFLAGGEMGERIRAHDWAATLLGAPEVWPQSLRSALSICLGSSFPTAIYWGAELRLLYNDAWAPIPAERHPWALGRPGAEVWADIWDVVGPQFARVIETGEGFSTYDQLLPMVRDGVPEETYWTYSFTPIRGEDGSVVGVLNQGHETTQRIRAERRQAFLLALADRLRDTADPAAIMATVSQAVGEHLGAARVGYADIDLSRGVALNGPDWTASGVRSAAGVHPLAAFGAPFVADLQAGRLVAIDDVSADARTTPARQAFAEVGIQALVVAPIIEAGRFAAAFFVHAGEPRRWAADDADLVAEVARRTRDAIERARAEVALRASEALRRQILNSATDYAIIATDLQGRVTSWNEGARRVLGWSEEEMRGETLERIFTPEDIASDRPQSEMRRALDEGVSTDERWHRREGGEHFWATDEVTPLRDDAGAAIGFVKVLRDRTEQRRAEEHRELLVNELNHRVKNTLATVQSIANQSFGRSEVVTADQRRAFEERLFALARAHDVLTRENWEGADLREIVAEATAPYANGQADEAKQGRFEVEGPRLRLTPRAALALAMALQELSTNAAKYGALSVATGRVSIVWAVAGQNGDRRLLLRWQERGGAPVSPPTRKGFGTRLIERGLAAELGGEVRLAYPPEGVVCAVDAPLPDAETRP